MFITMEYARIPQLQDSSSAYHTLNIPKRIFLQALLYKIRITLASLNRSFTIKSYLAAVEVSRSKQRKREIMTMIMVQVLK